MSQAALERLWDIIVIGTGIGGATIGHALAKAGFNVLFCEKGPRQETRKDTLRGDWAEAFYFGDHEKRPLADYLRRSGRRLDPILKLSENRQSMVPMLGQGSGGSSALYGMVLERFFPADFEPSRFAAAVPTSSAPQSWPVGYDELAPYYSQAERLYRVRSGRDPLRLASEQRCIATPPDFGAANARMVAHLQTRGLHPYHLPMACNYVDQCRECIGFICDRQCKNDSASICLTPAIDNLGATLLDDCCVEKVVTSGRSATAVHCRHGGQELLLKGKQIILAAGALDTPAVLLRSASADHPNGLGNRSDELGRNLMRHLLDYYIVDVATAVNGGQLVKQIAFNDFYHVGNRKMGTVQSNGRMPPTRQLARSFLQDKAAQYPVLANIRKLLERPVAAYLQHLLSRSIVLASLLEDYPYADNRITLTAQGEIAVQYETRTDDAERLGEFRQIVLDCLKPFKVRPVYAADQLRSFGHACGTCRFGNDPATSVLNANNRLHEIDNLYVVDASFLPTSSGTNPSLTIAANALRIADHLIENRQTAMSATA